MAACDLIKGAVVGALIGTALGILYAPKSGRETRDTLLKTAQDALEKAECQYDLARRKMEELVEIGKDLYKEEKKEIQKAVKSLS